MGSASSGTGRRSSVSCSASLAEEASSASVRLMMLQEEGEFHLFRQQHSQHEQDHRAAKRERMMQLLSMHRPPLAETVERRRRASEPDLLRCSDRVIANAALLTRHEYRRKRAEYLRSVFFRSDGHLATPGVGDKSVGMTPATLGVPGGRQGASSRLSLRVQQLDAPGKTSVGQQSDARSASSPVSSSNVLYKKSRNVHEDCCECAYRSLSETVTLSRRSGDARWRPCLVSGRDTLSCSVNSP